MSITDYCARLKTLADGLRDLDQPVSEPSQVLNMLRGLNSRYRHLKPVVTTKFPPHTFQSARSFLLLQELCDKHDSKAEAGQAYHAGHSSSSTSSPPQSDASGNSGGGRNKSRNKKQGRNTGSASSGNRGGQPGGGGGGQQQQSPNAGLPWAAGYNPWTGLVQAWPMPFRMPAAAGVLGPRPPVQPQQALTAYHQPMLPAPSASSPQWDPTALFSALATSGNSTPYPPSAGDWYMDTGATTHMSNNAGSSNAQGDPPM
ncbi:hypothetical protein BS78_K078200 [Paspalum vaginatum]|uniref:Uncharacterized protein n=1 Tax=Paspalum vaginatum TaxID=158149 RepID=A0A9W8CE34_9POAL|nr:hypothetical protein BS78_K078200 [Paspalum vaginatum]